MQMACVEVVVLIMQEQSALILASSAGASPTMTQSNKGSASVHPQLEFASSFLSPTPVMGPAMNGMACSGCVCAQDEMWSQLQCQLSKRSGGHDSSHLGMLPLQATAAMLLQPGSTCLQSLAAALQHCHHPAPAAELSRASPAELRSRLLQVRTCRTSPQLLQELAAGLEGSKGIGNPVYMATSCCAPSAKLVHAACYAKAALCFLPWHLM